MSVSIVNNMYAPTLLNKDCVVKKSAAKTKAKNELFFSYKITEQQAKEAYLKAMAENAHIFKSPAGENLKITLCWFPIYDISGTASGTYYKKTAWVAREFTGSSGSTDYYTNYYRDVYSSSSGGRSKVEPHYLIERLLSKGSPPFEPENNIMVYDDPDQLNSELSSVEFSATTQAKYAAERDIKSQYSYREQYHMTDKEKKALEKKAKAAMDSICASANVNAVQYHPFYIISDGEYNSLVNAVSGEIALEGNLGLSERKIKAAARREKLIKVVFFLLNLALFGAIAWFFFGPLWLERLLTNFANIFKPNIDGAFFALFLTVLKAFVYLAALLCTIMWFRHHNPDFNIYGQVNRRLKKLKPPAFSLLRTFLRMMIIFLIMEAAIAAIFGAVYYLVLVPNLTYVPTSWWWNIVPFFGFCFIGGALYGIVKEGFFGSR